MTVAACMMGLIGQRNMDIPEMRTYHMRHARTLELAMAICVCGMLSGGVYTFAGQTRPAAKTSARKGAWTIGIYTGPSPLQLSPPANVKNPVLTAAAVTDLKVDTLAHPFLVVEGSRYYLFFTAKHLATDTGGIGLAESTDGFHWKYRKAVVHEPFVTSHPYVVKWRGDYYMIPEAHTETSVRLYKATRFPDEWKYERDLLTGDHFISATLTHFKDMWWMFTIRPGNETLRLFYAKELTGPWTEHPLSPIVKKDLNTARPGGRPFVLDGALYRFAQDCYPTYGNQVNAFRITDLSPSTYAEQMIETPVVKASSSGWNADAMHHVDAHQIGKGRWIAVVDALGQ